VQTVQMDSERYNSNNINIETDLIRL